MSTRMRKHDCYEPDLTIDITGVYCKYYHRVFAWCCRITRNAEDAEDLTQDAFVHVMRKIHTFRGEATFTSWLYRVVMNTVFMQLRRKRLPQTSLDDLLDNGEGTLWHGLAMHLAGPAWRDSDVRVDLDRAIGQLPTGFKAVLLLHDVEEYRHREIAKLRGWTVGTSKSQLHRARQRLRELLADAPREEGCVSCDGSGQNNLKGVARRSEGRWLGNGLRPGLGEGEQPCRLHSE